MSQAHEHARLEGGAERISVGGALFRLALAAFMRGAREMKETGGFTWVRDTLTSKELKMVLTSQRSGSDG